MSDDKKVKKVKVEEADEAAAKRAEDVVSAEPKKVEGQVQSDLEAKRQHENETAEVSVRRDGNGALIV